MNNNDGSSFRGIFQGNNQYQVNQPYQVNHRYRVNHGNSQMHYQQPLGYELPRISNANLPRGNFNAYSEMSNNANLQMLNFNTNVQYHENHGNSQMHSQQPLGYGLSHLSNVEETHYANFQTSDTNAIRQAMNINADIQTLNVTDNLQILNFNVNVNFNTYGGASTGNKGVSDDFIYCTNPNLFGTGQVQTADVNSIFLPFSQGAASNVGTIPPFPDFDQLRTVVSSRPTVPDFANSCSSSKQFAIGLKRSSTYEKGEPSNKKKKMIQAPLTIRETAPAPARIPSPQQVRGSSTSRLDCGIHNDMSLYDPRYTRLGLPVDPLLRIFLEKEKQKKGKNKGKLNA